MSARNLKSYITEDGMAHFVDPGLEHLPLIQSLVPGFSVNRSSVPEDFIPNLVKTKKLKVAISRDDLPKADTAGLRDMHKMAINGPRAAEGRSASLLDLKVELARRELLSCGLCGRECHVNRNESAGQCGLREKAYVAETFLHIGEESVITPAATLKLSQCALNCLGCHAWEIVHLKEELLRKQATPLDGTIWGRCEDFGLATALEMAGGNPTESIPSIFEALSALPDSLSRKPIVWNDHGYITKTACELLDGVIDVYMPDFKGTDECVERTSRVKNYWDFVTESISYFVDRQARVIVRILVLPGHVDCCHKPALEWLAQYRDRLWISVLNFIPDHRALEDSDLSRTITQSEMDEIKECMKGLGLRDIEGMTNFWIGT